LVGAERPFEREGRDGGVHQPPGGEIENLDQFRPATPVGRLHRQFVRQAEKRHGQRAAAETDDGEVAQGPRHGRTQRQRLIVADTVQDDIRPAATGRRADLLHRALIGAEGVVGARPLRQRERLRSRVHGDHPRRRGDREQLHGQMPQATDADDDRRGAGGQLLPRAPHGVIGRERGIGQWSRDDQFQPLRQRHQVSRRGHKHELRHPAVQPEATAPIGQRGTDRNLAVALHAKQTPRATTAPPRPVDGDRLTDDKPGDSFTEGVDPPRILVTQREWWLPGQQPLVELPHQVQIRMARAGTADPHDHLSRPRPRLGDLDQFRIGFPVLQP
jgi:hypothetical protein